MTLNKKLRYTWLAWLALVAITITTWATFASVALAEQTEVEGEPLTFYTGMTGGAYWTKSNDIATRLGQRKIEVEVEPRKGSDDITLAACDNGASMWIAQIDALYRREMKDGCVLSVVAEYGTENAMLFFPPKSRLDELDDLDETSKVFVAGVGSGSELSFLNMQSIEKEFGRGDESPR